ncbi:RNA polymerase sigma factor [Candidatus Falkowbacteria bacterium]|jgi:RNA polymerase sigma-70 factor, ECF subfamily|nr:RNA polymerase sigma factor [Candidatus Falkowbacteria bacterium]MBT5502607.1 RNA polymerase sigma factor [Candidatus Falkowbacteria bacterium]MBT6574584.1 RNA polymerase sigma factor [Candidatus Falkowbacteria bacterium]MBT7348936.1 RNA polymerase sigma factor [Candidatus Falkowbacteria bacterium]MBT7500337.1 RNA polymerase sigma factor [Candidatus Falkowbacteria bacterium]
MTKTNQNSFASDQELVKLTLKNSDHFAQVINKYQPQLFYYIKRISNVPNEDIEDHLQEIFLKIYRNLNNYNQNLKFSSWLYRIARNHVISHHRKLKARPQRISTDWEINEQILNNIASDFELDVSFDNQLITNQIKLTLNKLDIKYKEVIVYRFFEDKSYEEIADILKKPIGTIGTLLNRAKKQFHKHHKE